MGTNSSKHKVKNQSKIISNVFIDESKDIISESSEKDHENITDVDKTEDEPEYKPVLKWKRANPNEEIVKIQQAAEIKDLEEIYINSKINDLMDKMPDHFWAGRENQLPRYVQYRGDDPFYIQDESTTNLSKMKQSSLSDLSNIELDSDFLKINCLANNNDITSEHKSEFSIHQRVKSNSSPNLSFLTSKIPNRLSNGQNEKPKVPKKGILKKKIDRRPISALITDISSITDTISHSSDHSKYSNTCDTVSEESSISNNEGSFIPAGHVEFQSINPISNENNVVMGYFDNITNVDEPIFDNCIDDTMEIDDAEFTSVMNDNDALATDDIVSNGDGTIVDINNGLQVNLLRKQQILHNLDKRLNMRPSSIELTNRNILHDESEFERNFGFETRKNQLNEKLSCRPTINELKTKRIIKFNDFIEVKETDMYDRRVNKTWARLTEEDRVNIRNELNELKKEMIIHTKSRFNTRFHEP